MPDLSQHHGILNDLFRPPADTARFRLGEEQVAFFQDQGYLKGVPVLSEKQVEQLRIELEPLLDPAHPDRDLFYEYHSNESADLDRVLIHALGAWRIAPAFHDLLWNTAITIPASQLLGGAVRFWHDQLFVKPAVLGGVVAWHQDFSYWTRTEPVGHLTCWIPLDDTDEESGCLQYVPRSHLWGLLPVTGLAGDMEAIRGVLSPAQRDAFEPIPMILRKGEASFHHPLTVHGSFPNTSSHPRRAIALNFCLDGTRSNTNEPLLEGVPAIPKGEPLGGRFFPIVCQHWTERPHLSPRHRLNFFLDGTPSN